MHSIGAFANITGVTIKALRHYEKLGLLAPKRSRAQYRRYSWQDMLRLERILALKSLGLPLRRIKALLARPDVALTGHREALQQKRARLDRAIEALAAIEGDAQPAQALRRFIADAAWERWEVQHKQRASTAPRAPDRAPESRLALFREIESALAKDPAGAQAKALAARWLGATDPETRAALGKRRDWPDGMRRYVASLYDSTPAQWERVIEFIDAHGRG